ncbi:hypothetical protein Tco_0520427 [Tanacetum coccineum]
MNPQETLQAAARDEKWVPSVERVKISSANIRLETIVPQKEETFQVIIDVIKNSMCFKAFTIFADVPEIFMQQFWYTIKNVQDTDSYKFLLANKKYTVNAEVFRTILDICPRMEGEDFTDVPDDETALTFLIDLGYKGLLNRHTNMFVDHMHQPWRTLATIINKCLSGKTSSNDKLQKSRIDILWGMFNRENVVYPELIWEDLAYQIDHRKEKRSRRENMTYPSFRIIADVHQIFNSSDSTQEKQRKGSKGKKTGEESQETVDVSEESEPEPKPEPAKKKTASRRVVKKKVTLSADDNIISNDPDDALELAKSISQTEAEEAEAARKVHDTHARIVTESISESAKKKSSGRSSKSVEIQDTSSAPKSKPATSKTKLKGAPSLTPQEQEAANIMQALKESKKTSKRQPSTGGSNEGTGSKPGVPDESIIVSTTSSEGTGAKPGVPDEDKDITEEKLMKDDKEVIEDEGDDHVRDTQDEDDKTESDEDDIYKYKICVRKDEDEEMKDAEVEGSDKGFGDQFLKLSSDSSLVSTVKDSADADVSSLLDIPIQHKTPQIQSPSVQKIPITVIPETTNLPPIPEIVIETPVSSADPSPQVTPIISTVQQTTTPIPTPTITTDDQTITTAIPESFALSAVELRVAKLEKEVSKLKTIDHFLKLLLFSSPKFQQLLIHLPELTKKPTPTAKQEYEKSPSEILKIKREQAESQKNPQFTIKSTNKATLKEYDLKSDLYQSMHANKSFNRIPANHRTKEYESSKKPSFTKDTPKGKTLTKGSKTSKSALAKEPVEEPIAEVIMDDVGDDVVHDDDQPQTASKPKTSKTLNPEWFKQPPRPPTPNPEWNKHQVVLNQPVQPWFNQMVSTSKNPLTFNDLINTPIDFSKYVLNGLQIENLTQDILLGPTFNLLKGTKSPPGHRTIAADYFFNNDLEYLKTSDPEVTYTTSITKTMAARYEIKRIEDMLYKFKEGDFVDLHLNDIEDMLLLAIQHKLFHLDGSDIVDFIVALRMFTRSLILKRRVKDLQRGVESYQKKLNITKPQNTFPEIKFKEPYTPSYDPPGIVYEELDKQKRVLRADELYKFLDGTLKSVRDEIHHNVLDFHLDYNTEMPKRKWTAVDCKRSGLMIELIDKQLREREIIRNLERLVGARELEMDYKLMTRTV